LLWLLARRKKKLLPLRQPKLLLRLLLLLTLLLRPLLPLTLLLRLLTLPLRPLPLLTLLLTPLLLLRPLLRKLLRLPLLLSNLAVSKKAGPSGPVFFRPYCRANRPANKKPAARAGFLLGRRCAYFSSSLSSLRILAPVGEVSGLPSLPCTVTWLLLAPLADLTSTR
jgi:hypothetical protein